MNDVWSFQTMVDEHEVVRQVARLDEGQRFIIERLSDIADQMKEDRVAATESRSKMHARLDSQLKDLHRVEIKAEDIGHIVAQQRDVIRELKGTVDANHAKVRPALEKWDDMRKAGKWLSWGLVLVGVSGASVFVAAKEWTLQMLRWLLRIDG